MASLFPAYSVNPYPNRQRDADFQQRVEQELFRRRVADLLVSRGVDLTRPVTVPFPPLVQSLIDSLHPKQRLVFESPARQILFGGGAGGGKSRMLRTAAIAWAWQIPKLQVYLFRRTFPDLYKNHMEGPSSFPEMLAPLVAEKQVRINYSNHDISFSNGSKIQLVHMQYEHNKENIQGAEIHVALIDELTHFTKSQYAYIRSRVRMVGVDVPEEHTGKFPRIVTASNPGSIGHSWVRALFIDSAPPGDIWQAPPKEGGLSTQFIPALLQDNPSMMEQDPDYDQRLQGLGNEALVKAMREGDWNIVAGGAIDDVFDLAVHVIPSFKIPATWTIHRSFDWGSSKPFSVGWWAISDGSEAPNGKVYPVGTRFRFAEWYGWNGNPNEGCKMLAVEIARGILQKEQEMEIKRISTSIADPSIFTHQNGVCIGDDMGRLGVRWMRGDASPGSRAHGLETLRKLLKAGTVWPMEAPGLFVFDTCRQWIRTVPVLPRDETRPDQIDTKAEDHCLIGSTLVDTRDGPRPIASLVGTEGDVLTATGEYVPYQRVRCTRRNAPTVKLVLEDGREIVCTPDHKFLTIDGEWVQAQDLLGVSICDTIQYANETANAYHRARARAQPHRPGISRRTVLSLREILQEQKEEATHRRVDLPPWVSFQREAGSPQG